MAAPSVVTTGTPLGAKQPEGWKCRLTFSLMPTFAVWAFEMTPGAVRGGPPIRMTSFFNVEFHTKRPPYLKEIDNWRVVGWYDTDIWKSTMYKVLVNRECTITAVFPSASTLSFYGYLMDIVPSRYAQGEAPNVELDLVVTNWDYINHVEAGPAYVDGYTGTADGTAGT